MVSLRPVGRHRPLLRAAARAGATGLSLPGLRLKAREDTSTRVSLDEAWRCPRVIFTSPEAVRSAARLRRLTVRSRQRVFALGEGTCASLRRAGIADVLVPPAADSENLLAMPALKAIAGTRIGLVTAPGGRGVLAKALRARGATLAIAEVYAREPARLGEAHARRLLDARGRGAVCVTSAEALRNVLVALPDRARKALLKCTAVVSSERLRELARDAGFRRTIRADGPTPRELLHALERHAVAQRFR